VTACQSIPTWLTRAVSLEGEPERPPRTAYAEKIAAALAGGQPLAWL